MHVEAHDPIESLPHLRRLKSHRTIAMRLQIVILAQQGRTAPQVVAATGISRRAVQEWVRRYNLQGIAGLFDKPRPGAVARRPGTSLQATHTCRSHPSRRRVMHVARHR